jgi:diguanylate cyclase (GGDEF)-like protein/PAS domain S-box-containing protein
MSYALAGQNGVLKATDRYGKRVLAAYALMPRISLGLVLKTDLEELYAPMRQQLGYLLAVTALLLGAGIWLLLSRIHPVATRLATSERRLQLALEASHLALWDWDISTGRVYLNERWPLIVGGEPGPVETTLEELSALVHPDDAPVLAEKLRAMIKGDIPRYNVDHRVRARSGDWVWIQSMGEVTERDRAGRALRAMGTNQEITARKQAEVQLSHQATHDDLTGLPNRALYFDRLAQAISRSRRNRSLTAVLYLDIDRFKEVNDSLGHAAGDVLLKEFARRLAGCARATDTVARLGGDEFSVILEGLGSSDDGLRIAANVVAAMRQDFRVEGRVVPATTSVGVVFHAGTDAISPAELVEKADWALYKAKRGGGDRFHTLPSASTTLENSGPL